MNTVLKFHVFLSNTNNSTPTLPIRLNTSKYFKVLLCITNDSIKNQSFIYKVKFSNSSISNNSIKHLFALSSNVRQFYLTQRTLSDAITPSHSGPGSDGNYEILHIPPNSSITDASRSDAVSCHTQDNTRMGS